MTFSEDLNETFMKDLLDSTVAVLKSVNCWVQLLYLFIWKDGHTSEKFLSPKYKVHTHICTLSEYSEYVAEFYMTFIWEVFVPPLCAGI